MKKLSILFFAMLFSSSAFAWEFTEISVSNRDFEVKNDSDVAYMVSNVRCMATDGYDSLRVKGYFVPDGERFHAINRTISGKNIRGKLNQIDDSLLPAYMNFCAKVNRHAQSQEYDYR